MKRTVITTIIFSFIVVVTATCIAISSKSQITISENSLSNNNMQPVQISFNDISTNTVSLTEQEIKEREVLIRQEQIFKIQDTKDRYLAYRKMLNDYGEYFDAPETIYDIYTEAEIDLMLRVIETEVHGKSLESKIHVANVILNRLESNRFSNNVSGVVVPGQFCFIRTHFDDETVMALEIAYLFGDTTDGALFFHSGNRTNTFNGASYIFTDDAGHHFYK